MDERDGIGDTGRERRRKTRIFAALALVVLFGFLLFLIVGGWPLRQPVDSQEVFGNFADPALELPPAPGPAER